MQATVDTAIRTGGTALSLYPHQSLADDAALPVAGPGFKGITLAHNVRTHEEVDAALAAALAAGATLVRPAREMAWGGYLCYFADPDGHVWEVTWNPGFAFADDGSLVIPE